MQSEFKRTLLKTMTSSNIEGRFDEPIRLRDLILHYDRTSAINAILSIMKAFKYVRFSATLTLPVDTLMASMMRMNVLSVCIGILLIGWGVTMNMIVGYELNNYRSFMESVLTLVKVIFGEADFGELMEVRSPRFEALRRLHFLGWTRGHLTMTWVVSFSILSCFGPRRGRHGVSEIAVASMASSRDIAATTSSSRSNESLRGHQDAVDAMPHRTESSDRDAPRRSTTACSRSSFLGCTA